jgi:hypothetical protein
VHDIENKATGADLLMESSPSPLTKAIDSWRTEFEELIRHGNSTDELPYGISSIRALELECQWVLAGLEYGFEILQTDPDTHLAIDIPAYQVQNYPQAYVHEAAITETIIKELDAGILIECMHKPKWLTALNIKVEPENKIRVLRDYSAPKGRAINEHTWNSEKMYIMTLDHGIAFMCPNYFMAKMDISNAFREVPIRKDRWENLSFEWKGKFYVDTRLPFGLSNAPEIFTRLTNLIRAMLNRRGIKATVVYVDDFLIVAETEEACAYAWNLLRELLTKLGFTVNMKVHKSVPPTTCLTFLGIILDTDVQKDGSGLMQASVAPDKLKLIITECKKVASQPLIRRSELESLIGKLSFISKVIYGARPYLRRMLDCLYQSQGRMIKPSKGLQLDVAFWVSFSEQFNGKALIIEKPIVPPHYFSVDAATNGTKGEGGIGGFFNGQYFGIPLSKLAQKGTADHKSARARKLYPTSLNENSMHINYLELFAIWWAIVAWGHAWKGYHIIIHTDNEAARYMLNKGTARAPVFMPLLRDITRRMALGGFRVQAVRVTTEANVLADPLSRGDWTQFYHELDLWRLENPSKEMLCLPRPSPPTHFASNLTRSMEM